MARLIDRGALVHDLIEILRTVYPVPIGSTVNGMDDGAYSLTVTPMWIGPGLTIDLERLEDAPDPWVFGYDDYGTPRHLSVYAAHPDLERPIEAFLFFMQPPPPQAEGQEVPSTVPELHLQEGDDTLPEEPLIDPFPNEHRRALIEIRQAVVALYAPTTTESTVVTMLRHWRLQPEEPNEGDDYAFLFYPMEEIRGLPLSSLVLALPGWTFSPHTARTGQIGLIAHRPGLAPRWCFLYLNLVPRREGEGLMASYFDLEVSMPPDPPPAEPAPSAWERL